MRGWMFSSVMSAVIPAKSGSSACVNSAKSALMPMVSKRMPRLAASWRLSSMEPCGGIGAGHADADDVLRAESLSGDGGHERRVDASAQSQRWLCGSRICAHNRACPARARDRRPRSRRLQERERGGAWKGSTTTRSSANEAACAMSSPRALRAKEEPSKMRLSLPPTWLHMSTGMRIAAGDGGQHFAADGALVVPERRRRKIDVQSGMLAHELFHGIDRVEPARPEVLVVPGILADGDGEANAFEFDHLSAGRRAKSSAARRRRRRRAGGACAAQGADGRGRGGRRR